MIISMDYDDTFTRDPAMWRRFIADAHAQGHQVLCVTMRHEHERPPLGGEPDIPCRVYCTGRAQKRAFMYGQGVHVNVWIDDMPEAIGASPLLFSDEQETEA